MLVLPAGQVFTSKLKSRVDRSFTTSRMLCGERALRQHVVVAGTGDEGHLDQRISCVCVQFRLYLLKVVGFYCCTSLPEAKICSAFSQVRPLPNLCLEGLPRPNLLFPCVPLADPEELHLFRHGCRMPPNRVDLLLGMNSEKCEKECG